MIEEIMVQQKRESLEQFAKRQRLLKILNRDKPPGFRHRLVVALERVMHL